VDLERDDDVRILGSVRQLPHIAEEGGFVLVGALVAADRSVDDGDAELRSPADTLDPVFEPSRVVRSEWALRLTGDRP
jgi:hypothetical protein